MATVVVTHILPQSAQAPERSAGRGWLSPQNSRMLFLIGALVAATGVLTPPGALLAGIAFACTVMHPALGESRALSKLLLQLSVISLGFGIDLGDLIHAGTSGLLDSAIIITAALALGLLLGRVFGVGGRLGFLISAGTAICGGSAIAALAPVTLAAEGEISLAMGTVFLLNSVALFLFPAVGAALHLSQTQFGLWAALGIHDMSSVVGAASQYGARALAVGTTVKLARALWIFPVAFAAALYMRRSPRLAEENGVQPTARPAIPWFLFLFCAASVTKTLLPSLHPLFATIAKLGRDELQAVLFLIGTGLSWRVLRSTGPRPLLQGILLWAALAGGTLWGICHGWLHA